MEKVTAFFWVAFFKTVQVQNISERNNGHREEMGILIMRVKGQPVKLEGFNNLTKSLNINIYDICYAPSRMSQVCYLDYIDQQYNSGKLESLSDSVTQIIKARLVQVSCQDYEPHGASVVTLLNEPHGDVCTAYHATPNVIGHLDKSHIAIHTYPEYHHNTGMATFRVDVDVVTCGTISPLNALRYLIESFKSKVVIVDYRVRGFTRDQNGCKLFIDHDIRSIQDYISDEFLDDYITYDVNIISNNNFHTKLRRKQVNLEDYLLDHETSSFNDDEKKDIERVLENEIQELFEGKNLFRGGGLI